MHSISSLLSLSQAERYLNLKTGDLFGHSPSFIENRFLEVEAEIQTRWENHEMDQIDFPSYKPHKKDVELAKEFKQLNAFRRSLHFNGGDPHGFPVRSNSDFEFADQQINHHRYRQPNCISFEHSKTDDSYNSTCLTINGRSFFALDGPTHETLTPFINLLARWNVKTLVSLTDEHEKGAYKCFPYWRGTTFEQDGQTFCKIPVEGQYGTAQGSWKHHLVQFLHLPDWQDHCGFDVSKLIETANQARFNTPHNEILAIHCSAGIGRTGTFLATVALLDEVDRQLAEGIDPQEVEVSIAKLFLKLNFYRRPMVAKEPQYIALYRVLDAYLDARR